MCKPEIRLNRQNEAGSTGGCGRTQAEQPHVRAHVPNDGAWFHKLFRHAVKHRINSRHGRPISEARLRRHIYWETSKPCGKMAAQHHPSTKMLYQSANSHASPREQYQYLKILGLTKSDRLPASFRLGLYWPATSAMACR